MREVSFLIKSDSLLLCDRRQGGSEVETDGFATGADCFVQLGHQVLSRRGASEVVFVPKGLGLVEGGDEVELLGVGSRSHVVSRVHLELKGGQTGDQ